MSEVLAIESASADLSSDDDDELASIFSDPDDEELTPRRRGLSCGMVSKSKSDSFCDCLKKKREKFCVCGEENTRFEWVWDDESKSAASCIKDDFREVMFHIDYSCGTAAVRGTMPMKNDQYFWEIKMTTPVYGTDMMIGVCTGDLDLNHCRHIFCSMIGLDSNSWGMSYSGQIQHKQIKESYSSKFGQGAIIGVHLDMWHGTLSFYRNRKPLGVAYHGLQGRILYPIVSSTAARSGMKVISNSSFPTSLQFMCCQIMRKVIPSHLDVLKEVSLPPGLRGFLENNVRWLLKPCPAQSANKEKPKKRPAEESDSEEKPNTSTKRLKI
ncbi:SPRY domain-containing SOCS box protein 3-like [Saccostrea echinata]|uniref:SPRY domain-containing SOCS box protein 3-like n=1 Tax=Saccostrea echinata TaxID=191078 RepID=UPI002A82AACD|nr:SPRY domain-containing SOCS box protein 3-like [Saccostrea echinata]